MDNINMGLGTNLTQATFVRKFRWTLESRGLPSDFVKDVNFDYHNKVITFSYYEVAESHAHGWVNTLTPDDKLTFITYTGLGEPMSKVVFSDLAIIGYREDFDYSKSDVAFTTITVSYNNSIRDNLYKPTESIVELCETQVESIDEIKIDHLNASMFVPGKPVLRAV